MERGFCSIAFKTRRDGVRLNEEKNNTYSFSLSVFKSPDEMAQKIVDTQKRKLEWVKKETDVVFTISASGKRDVEEILGIEASKVHVIYPGL